MTVTTVSPWTTPRMRNLFTSTQQEFQKKWGAEMEARRKTSPVPPSTPADHRSVVIKDSIAVVTEETLPSKQEARGQSQSKEKRLKEQRAVYYSVRINNLPMDSPATDTLKYLSAITKDHIKWKAHTDNL